MPSIVATPSLRQFATEHLLNIDAQDFNEPIKPSMKDKQHHYEGDF